VTIFSLVLSYVIPTFPKAHADLDLSYILHLTKMLCLKYLSLGVCLTKYCGIMPVIFEYQVH